MPARPSIVLDFIARNASLLQAAAQNERALRQQRRTFRQVGRSVGRATALYAGFAVAATAAARGVQSVGRGQLQAAQELTTFARATGASISELQQLEAAGARVGLVFDDVADVVQTFTESVGLARRGLIAGTGGAQLDALRFLGFSPEQILAAEQDIGRTLEIFFARLRQRSQAEQQEIIGEFSLPDAARRLLSLGTSPLQAGQAAGLAELSPDEIARLNSLFGRLSLSVLRLERSFGRALAGSSQEIEAFLAALERNTPLIIRASGTLANALGLLAGSVLVAYRGIEGAVGTGEEGRITQVDIIDTAIFVALIARFRTQLAQLLRTSAVRIVATLSTVIAGFLAAVFGGLSAGAVALVGTVLTFAVDQVITGGAIRGLFTDFFQRMLERLGLISSQAAQQAAAEDFQDQGPPAPSPQQQAVGRLIQSIRERIRQVEDTVEGLRLTAEQDTALGPVGDDLRALLRQQALLELQATTRQQAQALSRLADSDFIQEANDQFIIGLRTQAAELDQQIQFAQSPEAQALRQQLADAQRRLEAVEELPFDFNAFADDRRDALARQVEEAEALVRLSLDPQTQNARRRLEALDLAQAGRVAAEQINRFEEFAQQRRLNDRLQLRLAILETQEARRRVGQFAALNRQAENAAAALRVAQLEQELVRFGGSQAGLLRRQEEGLRARLENARLAEQVAQFEATGGQRLEARQLQQRLSQLQQIEDAQFALNNLETEYFDIGRAGLADLITGARSLRDVARQVLDQILRRTTERFVDAALLPAFAGGSGGGGLPVGVPAPSGASLVPGGGGAVGFAAKPTVEVNIDARGGDEQSVNRAVDRAVPRIAEAAAEINLDRLASSPVERYRFSQATQEDD